MMMRHATEGVNDVHSSENTQRLERLLAGDHAELDELLRALDDALAGGDAAAAFARLDLFWARLAMHIRAENLHLFPTILAALADESEKFERLTSALSEARANIAQLRVDHDFFMHELARAVKVLRDLIRTPGDECALNVVRDVSQSISVLAARLAAHNRLEEERVYRLPAILLGAAEQAELAANVERELGKLPPRFS